MLALDLIIRVTLFTKYIRTRHLVLELTIKIKERLDVVFKRLYMAELM